MTTATQFRPRPPAPAPGGGQLPLPGGGFVRRDPGPAGPRHERVGCAGAAALCRRRGWDAGTVLVGASPLTPAQFADGRPADASAWELTAVGRTHVLAVLRARRVGGVWVLAEDPDHEQALGVVGPDWRRAAPGELARARPARRNRAEAAEATQQSKGWSPKGCE